MAGIKIKMVMIDGVQRVPPEVMRLLLEYAAHRNVCDECDAAYRAKRVTLCATGRGLIEELMKQPEVQPM